MHDSQDNPDDGPLMRTVRPVGFSTCDPTGLLWRLARMRQTAAGSDAAASMYREVGVPLVEGLMAFHRGAFDDCVAFLLPLRAEMGCIGGSHARRDIVDRTLTFAALRAGRKA